MKRELTKFDLFQKDPYSDVYTFTHNGNNVGLLLKTNEAKISCEMSVRDAAGALQANSMLIPPPLPLCTLFKTKELKINESLVTPSDNSAHIIAWVSFLTRETPSMYKDSPAVNMSYLDSNAHMDDHNVPAQTRAAAVNNNNYNLVDFVDWLGEVKYIFLPRLIFI